MSNENFCTWTDANAFMRACLAKGDYTAIQQRDVIESAQLLESPLELVMLAALKLADKFISYYGQNSDSWRLAREMQMASVALRPAVPIGTYRADLVLTAEIAGDALQLEPVVIECDGYTFHDKTRDQAIRDRARDRYMQREGYLIARFAGDEIVEQPFACVFEAYDLMLRRITRVDREIAPPGGWPIFQRSRNDTHSGPPSLRLFDVNSDNESVSEAA